MSGGEELRERFQRILTDFAKVHEVPDADDLLEVVRPELDQIDTMQQDLDERVERAEARVKRFREQWSADQDRINELIDARDALDVDLERAEADLADAEAHADRATRTLAQAEADLAAREAARQAEAAAKGQAK